MSSLLALLVACGEPPVGSDGGTGGGDVGGGSASGGGSATGGGSANGGGSASGGGTAAGGGGSVAAQCDPLGARSGALTVWSQPDQAEAPVVSFINGATSSIRLTMYQLNNSQVIAALVARAKAGVKTQVILDSQNQGVNQSAYNQLTAAGASVQWSDPKFTYTHEKAMVVDDARLLLSTGNFDNYMKSARNYTATDADPDDVRSLAAIFDADWAKTTPDLSCTRLLVSPVNSRDRTVALIRSAQHTLDIEEMQFADTQLRTEVLIRKNVGVTVRVLIADANFVSTNPDAATWLKANNIEVRYRTTPKVHVKSFIIDGATAFFGSENFSYTSLNSNREVGLATTDPTVVTMMSGVFATDWATATAW